MKNPIKNSKRDYTNIAVAVAVTVIVGIFCFVAKFSLFIPLLLLFLGVHLFYVKKADLKLFCNLGLLLALLVFTANLFVQYEALSVLYIPVASVAILTMLLFNDIQLGFMVSFVSSILVGLIIGNDLSIMLMFFFGSLVGVYSVKGSRTRAELINAGFFVSLMQLTCIALLNPSPEFLFTKDFAINYLRPVLINGFICAGVVMFTLKIFESIFGVVTNFSLLELSDFNHPLLKRLVIEAPGTYHHSLIVSNLSETAAGAIGANSLLARVGAYYHDIGKLNKPQYFTENQLGVSSKHDNLEPTMSRLVILNHVKDGLELGKKHNVNPVIMDFIPEHHGTSLIYYFYQRALESSGPDETVDQTNFRYPGPKPQTRESATVLLADSVEGAVRALDEPTPARIAEVVRKIVNNKFIDGQLDECTLTLRDLEKICETFTHVLSAMYHSRIKYPDNREDESGINNKKPPKASFNKSQSNRPGRKKNPKG